MCGRFAQWISWKELHELLDLVGPPLNLRPRYNVAPSQDVAVARAADPGSRSAGPGPRSGEARAGRTLSMMRWGLIPAWAKDHAIGHKLINARSETAAQKPSFRSAFRHRRCLIPADGFYEWQGRGKTRKPWLFGLRGGAPFVFAGLWERWTVPEGAALTGSLAERRGRAPPAPRTVPGDASPPEPPAGRLQHDPHVRGLAIDAAGVDEGGDPDPRHHLGGAEIDTASIVIRRTG